jgi:16S rRNA (cytidine1402-2'-O)-methyltransferase
MGTLFLVATPIGNLEDITLRALRVLREARLIAAEDTRHTRRLLNHYEISTPCISYHEHNKLARLDEVLAALAAGDVALVSDAGTPAISDPGYELVNACIAAGFTVQPIPGPNAPVAALIASGLPTDRFLYVGFLPRRSSERRALFTELAPLTVTLICFESPHRLPESLADMLATLGDRKIAVANDLTKRFEATLRTTISGALVYVTEQEPRGEYTLVIGGNSSARLGKRDQPPIYLAAGSAASVEPSEAEIVRRLRAQREQGQSGSMAARNVARELGLQKSVVYQVWLSMGEAGDEPA